MQSTGFLVLIKLVPSLADVGIAVFVFLIARSFAGSRAGLFGAALIMFNPAIIFLSATWGQWDSISTCFMLAGLWVLLRGNPEWSTPLFTYAVLIKPQFGILLLVVAVVWWRWRVQGRLHRSESASSVTRLIVNLILGMLASTLLFFIVNLPFGVGLPLMNTRWTILNRMLDAANRHQFISASAFNLWGVFGKTSASSARSDLNIFVGGMSYEMWGMLLLFAATVASVLLLWRVPSRMMALWASLVLMFLSFMLPTRIHERYMLPSVVLAVLVSAVIPRLRWMGMAFSATYFANIFYVYHYFNTIGFDSRGHPTEVIPFAVSCANVFLLLVVFGSGFILAREDATRATSVAEEAVTTSRAMCVTRLIDKPPVTDIRI